MNVIYMVNGDKVTKIDLGKFKSIKKRTSFKVDRQILKNMNNKNVGISLNSKKAYIVIEGEEIYIKYFKFPKVSESKLYELINNELNYLYRNESFVFNYKKIKQSINTIEVIVFYFRSEELNLIDKFVEDKQLKAVRLIQMCVLNYYKKLIKEKDYFIVFKYNFHNYIMCVRNNNIYANEVYDMLQDKEYNKMKNFIVSNCEKGSLTNKIYIIGKCIKDTNIIKFLQEYGKINFLKDIDLNKISKIIV